MKYKYHYSKMRCKFYLSKLIFWEKQNISCCCIQNFSSGPTCSNLMKLLANVMLKYLSWNMANTLIIFAEKNVSSLCIHIFAATILMYFKIPQVQQLISLSLTRAQLFKANDVISYDSLKFTSSDTQICWNFLLKKMWVAFAVQKLLTFFFSKKFFAEKMWVAFAVQNLLTFFQQKISENCILNLLK